MTEKVQAIFDRPATRGLLNRTLIVFGAGFMPFISLALLVQMPMLVMVERKGVVDSMNRSWYLTDGYRDTAAPTPG